MGNGRTMNASSIHVVLILTNIVICIYSNIFLIKVNVQYKIAIQIKEVFANVRDGLWHDA